MKNSVLARAEPGKNDAVAGAASALLLFDIINPSDAYTFLAPDLAIAVIVTLYLGDGQYGARQIGGDLEVPLMIFGDPNPWFQEHFNRSMEAFLEENGPVRSLEIIAALESVLIGSPADRTIYELAMASIPDAKVRFNYSMARHDNMRSSMNDIGARAGRMALAMRKKLTAPSKEAESETGAVK